MSRVIIFSRFFPSYHPRKGEPTFFVEKIWKGLDTGNRHDGEYSIWTNKPRQMKDGHWQLPHVWRDFMLEKHFTPKGHTIRAGNRWKVGDKFSPRVWSGKPYKSKQITIAPDIEVKKVWKFEIKKWRDGILQQYLGYINDYKSDLEGKGVYTNDGLDYQDFYDWFKMDSAKKDIHFSGQIICWNENINY